MLFRHVHRQRHLRRRRINQPIEIDQMPAAHETQRIEELGRGGVTGDHPARVAHLPTDVGRQILSAGRCADQQIERVKARALKLVQYAGGENAALAAAFADQRHLTAERV